jgi:hypothetical protein
MIGCLVLPTRPLIEYQEQVEAQDIPAHRLRWYRDILDILVSGTVHSISEPGCKTPELRMATSSTKLRTEGSVGSHERSLTTAATIDT